MAFLDGDILNGASDGMPWLERDGQLNLPSDLREIARRDFTWDGQRYTVLSLEEADARAVTAAGLAKMPIRQALSRWPEPVLRPVLKGLGLLNWLAGAGHCGACGTELVDPAAQSGTAVEDVAAAGGRICPACGRAVFPRISPAVIVLVTRGDKALFARNARVPPGGRFGLLAGFVEAGETLEETAVREVREESGIEIGDLRYVASQPWPFPDSLMLAFTARWVSGEARADGREIAELRWCGRDELPEIPPRGSIARVLIDRFVEGG